MEKSIFSKIIDREIPDYKIYEDDLTYAMLDIHPVQPGHMLVIPKKQVDRLEDLDPKDYEAVMRTTRLLMRRVREVFGDEYRACLKVEGFDVPHAHVHIIPCRTAQDFWNRTDNTKPAPEAELKAMQQRLATN